MTFERLNRWDWVALAAALLLLLVMAVDWYSTAQGEEARRQERLATPHGALGGEVEREVKKTGAEVGEREERNAWQPAAGIDRLILVALLAAAGLAIVAAFMRAAGRHFDPPLTPSALAGVAAAVAALLVLYRMIQQPGLDVGATVKAGAPLALVALGAVAYASSRALRAEEAGTAFREVKPPPPAPEQGRA